VRVHFIASPSNGGYHLRSLWPAEALAARGWETEVTLAHLFPVDQEDVVVVHRPMAASLLEAVEAFTEAGVSVIVDTDDELEEIPPQNDWQASEEVLTRHLQAIRLASAITVTSERLADVYGRWARACYTVRNHLPSWVGKVRTGPVGDGRVRLGWAGTTGVHRQDLEWLAPVMAYMLDGALLSTVGDFAAARYLGLFDPGERFGWEPDVASFYRKMARADIGLVPLDNESCRRFNTSKSSLKAQEYLSLGIPVVVTDLPEQRRVVRHGVNGFVAASPEAFATCVQRLVRNPLTLERMAQEAHRTGRDLSMPHGVTQWESALEGVIRARASARAGEPANREGHRGRSVAARSSVPAAEER